MRKSMEPYSNNQIMVLEKELLIDIIKNAPSGSVWNIYDNEAEILPKILPQLTKSSLYYDKQIVLSCEIVDELINSIDNYNVWDNIIHQRIYLENNVIFESYDHMSGSYIKSSFPNFKILIEKYKGSDFELAELK
jgi:hypothetical protein